VPFAEDESVAVRPEGLSGVVTKNLVVQHPNNLHDGKGGPEVASLAFLHDMKNLPPLGYPLAIERGEFHIQIE
jgi:hypothetical protein